MSAYGDRDEIDEDNLIPHYLMSSYLYYVLDVQVLDDEEFDAICSWILEEYQNLRHRHKRFVSRSALRAGTGFSIPFDKLPTIVKDSAILWYNENVSDPRDKLPWPIYKLENNGKHSKQN